MAKHPRKASREPLTREKIVEKALELIEAEGIEAFSMRRLGEALGVEAMALYHHFPSKDAILDGVSARIIEETSPALPRVEAASDWKAALQVAPAAAERAMRAYPNAGWLFLGRQFSTTASLQLLETPLQVLRAAGFSGQELVDAAHAYFALGVGWFFLMSGQGGSWSGPTDEALAAAGESAPLAASLASELRDWSRGMERSLLALFEGLEARRED